MDSLENLRVLAGSKDFFRGLQHLYPRFKSGCHLQRKAPAIRLVPFVFVQPWRICEQPKCSACSAMVKSPGFERPGDLTIFGENSEPVCMQGVFVAPEPDTNVLPR